MIATGPDARMIARDRSLNPGVVRPHSARITGMCFGLLIIAVWLFGLTTDFVWGLAVLLLCGYVAAVVGIARPLVGLMGIGIVCTLDAPARHFLMTGGILRWNTLNYWLLTVMLLAAPTLFGFNNTQARLAKAFCFLLLVGVAFSPDPRNGINYVFAIMTGFGLLVYFLRASQDDQNWYWLGATGGVLGAAGGLVYFVQRDQLPYINPNVWALFPLTAIFCICLAVGKARSIERGNLVLWLLALANFTWIILSSSRGQALIGSICIVYLFSRMPGVRRRMVAVACVVLAGLFAFTYFTYELNRTVSRFELLCNSSESLTTRTSCRSELVASGLSMFSDHPMTGVGTGGFQSTMMRTRYRSGWQSRFSEGLAAHSGWIKTLAENGLPGILLHASFVFSFAIVGWRKQCPGTLAFGLMATIVLGVACVSSELGHVFVWFLASGAIVVLQQAEPTLREKPLIYD
jgi:O-antigen ligase